MLSWLIYHRRSGSITKLRKGLRILKAKPDRAKRVLFHAGCRTAFKIMGKIILIYLVCEKISRKPYKYLKKY